MIRKFTLTIALLITLGLVLWIATHPNVEFHLKDSQSQKFVKDPNIQAVPGLTQVAAPGTGGAGPLIYAIGFPRTAIIKVKTRTYKTKQVRVFLFPGLKYTIWLEKES